MIRACLIGTLLVAAAGCTAVDKASDAEASALRHVRLGERYEHAFQFRQATTEYSMVAQYYPTTSVYTFAVLHLALLYGNQANPVRDDSLALRWIKIYLELPLSTKDRENAELYYSLIERIGSLEQDLVRQEAAFDSLATSSRKVQTLIPDQARRIQELEAELKRSQEELKRLKEVDIRTSKRGIP